MTQSAPTLAQALDLGSAAPLRTVGATELRRGRPAAAIEVLEVAVTLDVNDLASWRLLARAYRAAGRIHKATAAEQFIKGSS